MFLTIFVAPVVEYPFADTLRDGRPTFVGFADAGRGEDRRRVCNQAGDWAPKRPWLRGTFPRVELAVPIG